jgi:hypothetical protein
MVISSASSESSAGMASNMVQCGPGSAPATSGPGAITLQAAEAILHGSELRYQRSRDNESIGFWDRPNEWVEWIVRVARGGSFAVIADIASIQSNTFEISLTDQLLRATVQATGGYQCFQTIHLGFLQLIANEQTALSVIPCVHAWNALNLKTIHLVPQDVVGSQLAWSKPSVAFW